MRSEQKGILIENGLSENLCGENSALVGKHLMKGLIYLLVYLSEVNVE